MQLDVTGSAFSKYLNFNLVNLFYTTTSICESNDREVPILVNKKCPD